MCVILQVYEIIFEAETKTINNNSYYKINFRTAELNKYLEITFGADDGTQIQPEIQNHNGSAFSVIGTYSPC